MWLLLVIEGAPFAVLALALHTGVLGSAWKVIALGIAYVAWSTAWSVCYAHDARLRAALWWRERHRRSLRVSRLVLGLLIVAAFHSGWGASRSMAPPMPSRDGVATDAPAEKASGAPDGSESPVRDGAEAELPFSVTGAQGQ